MTDISSARFLELVAVDVAELAAELVRGSVGQAAATGTKSSPTDVVTRTDFSSERLIRAELMQRCPGSTIVGEEYDDALGANNIGWIVDPIDGTINFLYDLSVVAVSIAATVDDRVVAGAVADVHRRETYSATSGMGARRDGVSVHASDATNLGQALVGTGFAYDAEVRSIEARTLLEVLPACRDIRCMGSAALNLCWVADGRLDGFYERDLKVYDYAAGALIAAEGGATVELPAGDDGDLVIAATDDVFDSLRDRVTVASRG